MTKIKIIEEMINILMDNCKKELGAIDLMLVTTKDSREKSKLLKEKAFWSGKLESAEYAKFLIGNI